MISIEAWRACIGSFTSNKYSVSLKGPRVHVKHNVNILIIMAFVFPCIIMCLLGLLMNAYHVKHFALSDCTHDFKFCFVSFMLLCFLALFYLILLCGDIETNPGPTKSCPNCSMLVHIRKIVCSHCGYIFAKGKGSCASINIAKTLTETSTVHVEQHSIEKRKKNKERNAARRALLTTEEKKLYREADRLAKLQKK